MASKTLRSRLSQRSSNDVITVGGDNHFIFAFDRELLARYGDFLDNLDRVANKHNLDDISRESIYLLCDLSGLIEVMLHENNGNTAITESVMDDLFEHHGQEVGGDLIEEWANFCSDPVKPLAWKSLNDLYIQNNCNIYIDDVIPFKEENMLVYVITRIED